MMITLVIRGQGVRPDKKCVRAHVLLQISLVRFAPKNSKNAMEVVSLRQTLVSLAAAAKKFAMAAAFQFTTPAGLAQPAR